jgi:hypothetical protein
MTSVADFTSSSSIPSNLTFARTGAANSWNSSGVLTSAATGVARFDYDPSTLVAKGLLIEEARINRAYKPFTLWGSSGTKGIGLGTATTDLAGASNAWPLLMQAGAGTHQIFIGTVIVTTASAVTMSCYVKPNGYNRIAIREAASTGASSVFLLSGAGSVIINNTAGSVTSVVGSIVSVGGGWYRIMTTMTPSASIGWTIGFNIVDSGYTSGDPSSYSFAADGTSTIIACFPQLEVGGNVSSYIDVPSTTAITRNADILSSTDATLLGQLGWVIETGEAQASTAATLLGINTAVGIGYTTGNALTTADGGTQTTSATGTLTGTNRGGIAFDSTPRVSISLNGSAATTAANTPVTPTSLYFGNTNNGASGFLNGHVRKIDSYSTLTDAALAANTSLGTASPIYIFPRNRHYVRR